MGDTSQMKMKGKKMASSTVLNIYEKVPDTDAVWDRLKSTTLKWLMGTVHT
jgi:hypothetical protein